jgi:hypothetical protein
VGVDAVYAVARRLGLNRRQPPFDVDELERRYAAGESIRSLAEEFGSYPQALARALRARGVKLRGRVKAEKGEVIAQFLDGASMTALAERYDMTVSGVSRLLSRAGVTFEDVTERAMLRLSVEGRFAPSQIAAAFGVEQARVIDVLAAAGVATDRAERTVDDAEVVHLYLTQRVTIGELMGLTGRDRPEITGLLDGAGVVFKPGRRR